MFTDALVAAILVAQLGSPSFTVRQNAECVIAAYGERAECQLAIACMDSDPEVRRRAECLRARLLPGKLDRLFMRHHADGGVPWADAIAWPHPKHRQLYGDYCSDPRVEAQAKLEEKLFSTYRAITRLWITDSIYSGTMTFAEAEHTLAAMAKRHPLWQGGKWMDEANDD